MSDRLAEFGDATEVILVTFTDRQNLTAYNESHDLPFPVLTDPQRETYRAFGLGRGSVMRVWGLKSARRYMEIFRESGFHGLRKPTEDTLQLGGDFIIGPTGNLEWAFWGEGPDDRPSVDDLVAAVEMAST